MLIEIWGGEMKFESLGIAIMAVCMSLAFMPAGASDFTLEIYGNANLDDIIDEQDIKYVFGIIDGTNEPTLLADANQDSKIDEADIDGIREIIEDFE